MISLRKRGEEQELKSKYVKGFDCRLRQAIRNKEMSYNQVAVLLGIPWNSMNGYLNEKQMPCCLYLVKMAKLLNVSTDWLLGLKGE